MPRKRIESWRKDATKQYESGVEAFLSALQIASKSDVQRIDRKISQLNRKLREMDRPKSARKATSA
jgi:polyhydroxyalkanoate synthesis regulator phasin